MAITIFNVCQMLCHGNKEIVTSICRDHLDILKDGLLQLDPCNDSEEFVIFTDCAYRLNTFFKENKINKRQEYQPYIALIKELISTREVYWQIFIYRLPRILREYVHMEAINDGIQYNHIFKLDDEIDRLSEILHIDNRQSDWFNGTVNYSSVGKYLFDLIAFNVKSSFYLLQMGRMFETLNIIDSSISKTEPISYLYFESQYCNHIIKDSAYINPCDLQHLHLPPSLTIDTFDNTHILEYLEYNYASYVPTEFFNRLKLHMHLNDTTDITLPMLQFVYTTFSADDNYDTSVTLPLII